RLGRASEGERTPRSHRNLERHHPRIERNHDPSSADEFAVFELRPKLRLLLDFHDSCVLAKFGALSKPRLSESDTEARWFDRATGNRARDRDRFAAVVPRQHLLSVFVLDFPASGNLQLAVDSLCFDESLESRHATFDAFTNSDGGALED